MTASIGDVAKAADVSVATVSRALRGLPNVAPSTRERVVRAAEALSYVADATATRLATGRTLTVGVAVTQLGQWFTAQVLAGVEAVLTPAGYDLLLLTVVDAHDRAQLTSGQRTQGRVDGLIGVDITLDEGQQRLLSASGVPVVLIGIDSPHLPSVGIDHRAAAKAATSHLVDLGHRRIGMVGHLVDASADFPAPRERREGYLAALHEAGIDPDAGLETVGNFSLQGGAEAAAALLAGPEPPTAVFALSDEMAIGALGAARRRGVDVPGDLSIIGFDDHDAAAALGLTTVAQPVMEQAQQAADLLLTRLQGGDHDPAHVVLPTRLIVRATTGPPSRDCASPPCQRLGQRP